MKNKKDNKGFTMIEMMISIGLFSVVMIVGIGSVLSVNRNHRETSAGREALDTLNFIMEEVARTARLGDLYHCGDFGVGNLTDEVLEDPENGDFCTVLAYEPYTHIESQDPEDQRTYGLVTIDDGTPNGQGVLLKSPNQGVIPQAIDEWLQLTPDDMYLDIGEDASHFRVVGAESSDGRAPMILIRLKGEVRSAGGAVAPFDIQTSVTQRLIQTTP